MKSVHVSEVIAATPDAVYDVVMDAAQLPKWAAGLATSEITRGGDRLLVTSPMGQVAVTFVPRNDFGVADHDVELPNGEVVHNPLRVMPHPHGAEVIFTVRQRTMSDAEFQRDVDAVARDLAALRALVEDD